MDKKQQFHVKTRVFEGPLDLLLSLIEKHKLHINDISLSKVTDEYITYVNAQTDFPTGQVADFILVASALVLIKSKSLLPTLQLSEEEQESIEDLERRLKEYKRIKELSHHVRERFGKMILFRKLPNKNIEPIFSPDKNMTVENLLSAVRGAIRNLPKVERLAQAVIQKVVSLEEMITHLTDRIASADQMSFKEFSKQKEVKSKEEKIHVIVSFLAMLELVKQGIIRVSQDKLFEDIRIETENIDTPRYH